MAQARVVNGGTVETDAPKSRASARTVPVESMHPGTVALLRALRRKQAADRLAAGRAWQESGLVLVDELGRGYRPDTYSREFRSLIREAGLPAISLHNVRHSVGTLLHTAGVPIAPAAALLGHSTQVHMSVYVTATDDGVEAAGAALATVLRSAQ